MAIFRSSAALICSAALSGALIAHANAEGSSALRVLPSAGVTQLQVHANAADIAFTAAQSATAVTVRAIVLGNATPHIDASRAGSRLTVTLSSPAQNIIPFVQHGSVRYEIAYPANVALQVHDQTGDLRVDGSRANVAMETNSGDIEVRGAHGGVDVLADTGDVTVTLARGWAGPSVRMQAGTGDLHLRVPPSLRARIDASSDMGSIRSSVQTAAHPKAETPLVWLYTHTGDVTIASQ